MKRANAKVIAFIAFVSLISLSLCQLSQNKGKREREKESEYGGERILFRKDKSVSERKIKLSDQ